VRLGIINTTKPVVKVKREERGGVFKIVTLQLQNRGKEIKVVVKVKREERGGVFKIVTLQLQNRGKEIKVVYKGI
jgi:hypothetical protein